MAEENGNGRLSNGQFGPGNKGGSGRGPNKVSTKVKESIIAFLEANIDKIQADFDTLKARERLQFIADIIPYAAPKLSSIQTENQTHLSGGINISWSEPELHHSNGQGSNGELQRLPEGLPDNS